MVVSDPQVEEGGRGLFYFDTSFVQSLRRLNVAFLQFLGSLFETLVRLHLCRVRSGGMRGRRRGETWGEQ